MSRPARAQAAPVDRAVTELRDAVRRLSEVPAAAERVQHASTALVEAHEKLARQARRTRSRPALRATRPAGAACPAPEGDLTSKFKALR